MTDYTPYQQRIIKNYYNNRQALALQKLNELVADLYLAATDRERERLWKKVAGALANLNVPPQISDHILLKRSPEVLAANLKDWWEKMPRDKPPKPPRQGGQGSPSLLLAGALLAAAILPALPLAEDAPGSGRRWPAGVEEALGAAGPNRGELVEALERAPAAQRRGLEFLIANMPRRDLESLPAAYLLENTALAYEAIEKAPWGRSIPEETFLNEVLPYASVTEKRDPWRRKLREICAPLVEDCRTPAEAAHRLNQRLFGVVKVKYSTARRKTDQSPLESMESGLASCTGLSILLIDGCRSVGVPARLAGIPSWIDNRGNHTWVEIWDGSWHFTGAAEPAAEGLDHAWFQHDASLAREDSRRHAIYAASFRKTPLSFPMVWARRDESVSAVNVTGRYTASRPAAADRTRLRIDVRSRRGGARVAAQVIVTGGEPPAAREGTSRDGRFDTNDLLAFDLPRGMAFEVRIEHAERVLVRRHWSDKAEELLEVFLEEDGAAAPEPAPPPAALRDALAGFFGATAEEQAGWKFDPSLEKLLLENEPAVRQAAWEAYRSAPIHADRKRDHDARQVRSGEYLSPYTLKTVGERPPRGRALFIALHGGGGTAKRVNDSQWRAMQGYYRDQPDAGGYLYLALRAPTDDWNGFYTDYVYPLIENLIRQLLLFEEVDPDKVFILGYSHGGYGAFAIGPKMPDRFAAIHSSAAAPTDGESSPKTLRNTPFTYMVGENDHAYGRVERCRAFDAAIQKLRGDRTDIYPVTLELKEGFGHGGLPDRDKIRDLYPAVRNPAPRELTWELTDAVVRSFYWLQVSRPGKGRIIEAGCRDNRIAVKASGAGGVTVRVDSRLIDFHRPVDLEVNGSESSRRLEPSLLVLCRTLLERGDPALAFTAEIPLD